MPLAYQYLYLSSKTYCNFLFHDGSFIYITSDLGPLLAELAAAAAAAAAADPGP